MGKKYDGDTFAKITLKDAPDEWGTTYWSIRERMKAKQITSKSEVAFLKEVRRIGREKYREGCIASYKKLFE